MTVRTKRAAEAVSMTARGLGLCDFDAIVLGGYSNTLIRLAPYPIVARVATADGVERDVAEILSREIAMADYVERNSRLQARLAWLRANA